MVIGTDNSWVYPTMSTGNTAPTYELPYVGQIRMDRDVFIAEIKGRIKAARTSAKKLPVKVGLKEGYIYDIFNGKTEEPGIFKMHLICKGMGCTIEDLLEPNPDLSRHIADVGNRLRIAIEGIGKTPEEITKEFGVSIERLGYRFGGVGYPDMFFLDAFCQKYGSTMDWLFRDVSFGVPSSWADRFLQEKEASQAASPAKVRQAL
jgi:transcriptional regulator with XRE-family HTH domain